MKPPLRSFALLVLAGAALSAQATVLDFEHLTGGSDAGVYTEYGSVLDAGDGYRLYASAGFYSENPGTVDPGFLTLPTVAIYPRGAEAVRFDRFDGGLFNLLSLDVANIYPQSDVPGGGKVTFTGTLAGGGTVSQSFFIPADDALHTVTFSGFVGLTSLSLSDLSRTNGQYAQYDNLNVSAVVAVPSPLAALPFALGLLRRRRKA